MKSIWKFLHKPIALAIKSFVLVIIKTLRVEIQGIDEFREAVDFQKRGGPPIIVTIWHNNLFLLPLFASHFTKTEPLTILISKSRDGNIPALIAESFPGVQVIRIGHRTRHQSLIETIHALENKRIVILTPDGPRGPRHSVKPGAVFACQTAKGRLFALTWNASSAIELNTWDRFVIPLPFSKVHIHFHKPLEFKPNESTDIGAERLREEMLK